LICCILKRKRELGVLISPSTDNSGTIPLTKYMSISPLYLIGILPLYSQIKKSLTRRYVAPVILISPGTPEDSILEAILTVSPQISREVLFRPTLPAITGPV